MEYRADRRQSISSPRARGSGTVRRRGLGRLGLAQPLAAELRDRRTVGRLHDFLELRSRHLPPRVDGRLVFAAANAGGSVVLALLGVTAVSLARTLG